MVYRHQEIEFFSERENVAQTYAQTSRIDRREVLGSRLTNWYSKVQRLSEVRKSGYKLMQIVIDICCMVIYNNECRKCAL